MYSNPCSFARSASVVCLFMSQDYSTLVNEVYSTSYWLFLALSCFSSPWKSAPFSSVVSVKRGKEIIVSMSCETPTTNNDCRTNGGLTQENSERTEHPSASRLLTVKKTKIVLHVDLNNTILVSDAVTKQGTVAALEHFLSTVTWGRMAKGELDTQLGNMMNI